MKSQRMLTIAGSLLVSVVGLVHAQAQGQGQGAAPIAPCLPQPQTAPAARGQAPGGAAAPGRGPAQPQGERETTIAEIPGVVAAGVKWTKVYQVPGNSADGIVPTSDGGVLMAGEDLNQVTKVDKNGKATVFIDKTNGAGSLSVDRQGRIYAVQRMLDPRAPSAPDAPKTAAIVMLAPQRKVLASTFGDGSSLPGRPNDLAADSKGGAFFTQGGCVYYASPSGKIAAAADNLRTNGIVLSKDDKTLYVTNGPAVAAFDVQPNGTLTNRRDQFGKLEGGGNGDGMTIDDAGRLYVTSAPGVQVLAPDGKYLGLIPTPRNPISVAFAGSDKKSLYVVCNGASDESGKPIASGPQQTGRTIYMLPLVAQGYKGRPK